MNNYSSINKRDINNDRQVSGWRNKSKNEVGDLKKTVNDSNETKVVLAPWAKRRTPPNLSLKTLPNNSFIEESPQKKLNDVTNFYSNTNDRTPIRKYNMDGFDTEKKTIPIDWDVDKKDSSGSNQSLENLEGSSNKSLAEIKINNVTPNGSGLLQEARAIFNKGVLKKEKNKKSGEPKIDAGVISVSKMKLNGETHIFLSSSSESTEAELRKLGELIRNKDNMLSKSEADKKVEILRKNIQDCEYRKGILKNSIQQDTEELIRVQDNTKKLSEEISHIKSGGSKKQHKNKVLGPKNKEYDQLIGTEKTLSTNLEERKTELNRLEKEARTWVKKLEIEKSTLTIIDSIKDENPKIYFGSKRMSEGFYTAILGAMMHFCIHDRKEVELTNIPKGLGRQKREQDARFGKHLDSLKITFPQGVQKDTLIKDSVEVEDQMRLNIERYSYPDCAFFLNSLAKLTNQENVELAPILAEKKDVKNKSTGLKVSEFIINVSDASVNNETLNKKIYALINYLVQKRAEDIYNAVKSDGDQPFEKLEEAQQKIARMYTYLDTFNPLCAEKNLLYTATKFIDKQNSLSDLINNNGFHMTAHEKGGDKIIPKCKTCDFLFDQITKKTVDITMKDDEHVNVSSSVTKDDSARPKFKSIKGKNLDFNL